MAGHQSAPPGKYRTGAGGGSPDPATMNPLKETLVNVKETSAHANNKILGTLAGVEA